MSRTTSEGEAEAVKEKRDRVGHPTADRPNSLPYYPRLWSSGTGVLSRDSLSQRLRGESCNPWCPRAPKPYVHLPAQRKALGSLPGSGGLTAVV